MDGYFPSELQQRFPDGVPFEVRLCNIFSICKSCWYLIGNPLSRFMTVEMKNSWSGCHGTRFLVTDKQFVGRNQQIQSALCQVWSERVTVRIGHNLFFFFCWLAFWFRFTDGRLTTDQFLNKLPKVVVKAGNVINIRGSLRRTLQVRSRDPSINHEPKPLLNTLVLSSGSFWCSEKQLRDSHWHTSTPSDDGEVNKVTMKWGQASVPFRYSADHDFMKEADV